MVGNDSGRTFSGWLVLSGLLFACSAAHDENAEPVARARAALGFVAPELLGRPTDRSVTLKAHADAAVDAYVEYGAAPGAYTGATSSSAFANGLVDIVVSGLSPDTRYYYRLRHRSSGSSEAYAAGAERTFRTQRSPGSAFTFAVQSDSHQGFAPFYSDALYGVTLANLLADRPDFLLDLGDTISTDDAIETESSVRQKYLAQRASFGAVSHSVPVFLVLGNHENEEGWNLDDFGSDRAASLPVLGASARKRYFANPVPDAFYSGNREPLAELEGDQLRGNYYAFEWGSALFVALDPFWYTTKKPFAGSTGGEKDDEVVGDRWDWTLGKAQYDWLKQTLSASRAPFKFVFAHHPTGGTADYVRGGARGAKYCEWGGYDTDGVTWGFDQRRPGWGKPVHQVLVEGGVSAFFHGHDHLYAREVLDGIVYQAIPHAANDDYGSGFPTNAADYEGAVRFQNSGHVRVTVSPALTTVAYVRAFLPGDGDNGSVAHSYTISPCDSAGSDGRSCDDGDACTTSDRCSDGVCAGGGARNCDDGNACTDDACDRVAGCRYTNNGAACDDDNPCTDGDRCASSTCSGVPRKCAAEDECRAPGTCNLGDGTCSSVPVADGEPCAGGECRAGACVESGSGSAGAGGKGGGAGATGGHAGTHDGSAGTHGGSGAAPGAGGTGHGVAGAGGAGADDGGGAGEASAAAGTAGGGHSGGVSSGAGGIAAAGSGGKSQTGGTPAEGGAPPDDAEPSGEGGEPRGGGSGTSAGTGGSSGAGGAPNGGSPAGSPQGGEVNGAGTSNAATSGDVPSPGSSTPSPAGGCTCSHARADQGLSASTLLLLLLGAARRRRLSARSASRSPCRRG